MQGSGIFLAHAPRHKRRQGHLNSRCAIEHAYNQFHTARQHSTWTINSLHEVGFGDRVKPQRMHGAANATYNTSVAVLPSSRRRHRRIMPLARQRSRASNSRTLTSCWPPTSTSSPRPRHGTSPGVWVVISCAGDAHEETGTTSGATLRIVGHGPAHVFRQPWHPQASAEPAQDAFAAGGHADSLGRTRGQRLGHGPGRLCGLASRGHVG